MLLTKECDYGVRIIRALADNEKKTVKVICALESIPFQYTYKIIKKLEKAGFVQSYHGPNGGYQLIKPLHTFTLYDVIIAVDEDFFIFECVSKEQICLHNRQDQPCSVHLELERIQQLLLKEMQAKSIENILLP